MKDLGYYDHGAAPEEVSVVTNTAPFLFCLMLMVVAGAAECGGPGKTKREDGLYGRPELGQGRLRLCKTQRRQRRC